MKTFYRSLDGQLLTAEYKADAKLGVPYLEIRDAESQRVLCQPIMGEGEAHTVLAYLKGLGEP